MTETLYFQFHSRANAISFSYNDWINVQKSNQGDRYIVREGYSSLQNQAGPYQKHSLWPEGATPICRLCEYSRHPRTHFLFRGSPNWVLPFDFTYWDLRSRRFFIQCFQGLFSRLRILFHTYPSHFWETILPSNLSEKHSKTTPNTRGQAGLIVACGGDGSIKL